MGVEGLAKCMKFVLIIFNAIFVILGAGVPWVGIWILLDKEKLMELAGSTLTLTDVPSLLQQGAYILLGGGGFMFLIGIFGCVGACRESRVMLTMYGILVLIVFTLELVAGILAAVYRGKIESELKFT
ncbi:tetraspanin-18-like [Liolophura sinensis]|uniref:tetraspanin-18-like n=1 Tax=Liolophura sinensis TaxID=3198878 RepID=UPI003158C80B